MLVLQALTPSKPIKNSTFGRIYQQHYNDKTIMKKAIFPGSFDPFTIGHYNVVMRGLELFDHITIAIGTNQNKKGYFDLEQRIRMIEQAFANEPRVRVQSYNCLTVDYAQQIQATQMLRGLRTVADFEYERSIADANKHISGIDTVLLLTDAQYSFVSSSMVRELHAYGKDISAFLPEGVTL